MSYSIGQRAGNREIVAIEGGKVCVADYSGAKKYQASTRWYKLNSPILAKIFGGAS